MRKSKLLTLCLVALATLGLVGRKKYRDYREKILAAQVEKIKEEKGIFRTTQYYTPFEEDYETWSYTRKEIGSTRACKIPERERGFYESVMCEGAGIAKINGQEVLCTYDNTKPEKNKSKCKLKGSMGMAYDGSEVELGRTIAVDPKVIPNGSLVELKFYEDKRGIKKCETDLCEKANGFYVASDRGSMIKGKRIDIYSGREPHNNEEMSLPNYAKVSVISSRNLDDELKNYVLARYSPRMYKK